MSASLPDFRLGVYLGRCEFGAPHYLTASDAETLTVGELLTMATEEQRRAFEDLPLGYAPPEAPTRCARRWPATTRSSRPSTCSPSPAPRRPCSGRCRSSSAQAITRSSPCRTTSRWRRSRSRPARRSTAFPRTPRTAGRSTSGRSKRCCGRRLGSSRSTSRTTRPARSPRPRRSGGWSSCATSATSGCSATRSTGGSSSTRSARCPRRQTSRHARCRSTSCPRPTGCPACASAGSPAGTALLERLERRKHYTSFCNAVPSEALATIALEAGDAIRARNRDIVAANLPIFDDFFGRWEDMLAWEHPAGGCVSFPRLTTGEPSGAFCRRLVEEAGVVLLPSDVHASDLADVPDDRFRIGVGRRGPEPALAAFEGWLRQAGPSVTTAA